MSTNKFVVLGVAAALVSAFSSSAFAGVDITSQKGITIGGAIGGAGGKFVPWGGSVALTDADAFLQSNGHCAFNVNYDVKNAGDAATDVPFKNWIIANGSTVAINGMITANGMQSFNPGQTKQVSTQPYLPLGSYDLKLKLDTENNLIESNEGNNEVSIKVVLTGSCFGKPVEPPKAEPKADLVSKNGITIGGGIGAVGGKYSSWGGTIILHTEDTFLHSGGKCAVNISYDMENVGTAAAGPAFANRMYSGSTLISQQSALSLDKGASKQVIAQAYMLPGANVLKMVLDDGNAVAESNEVNNTVLVNVILDSNCGATPATTTTKATTTTTKEATTTTKATTTTTKATTTTTSPTQRK